MNRKIALFGGTFDPIHNGHLLLAEEMERLLGLDTVIFMPTFIPPHKIKPDLAPAVDRMAMCKLAAEGHPHFIVSDRELNRRGASFTVDTLNELAVSYPDAQLYLLTGADMFLTLATWHRFEDIAKLAVLCTVPRDGITLSQLNAYAEELEQQGATCVVADIATPNVSSTEIRQKLAAGEDVSSLIPPAVAEYAKRTEIYAENRAFRNVEEQYDAIIRGRLTPKRYYHSLAVSKQAEHLAKLYGADPDKARVAGLLHDVMKDTDAHSQLQIFKDFGILLDEVESASPKLWHARAGAVFIEHILGLTDADILNAVRYHTTGRAKMSPLETTLYMADFTSADRDYPDADKLRKMADRDLNEAMEFALRYTIDELEENGSRVHPDTLACYEEYRKG